MFCFSSRHEVKTTLRRPGDETGRNTLQAQGSDSETDRSQQGDRCQYILYVIRHFFL